MGKSNKNHVIICGILAVAVIVIAVEILLFSLTANYYEEQRNINQNNFNYAVGTWATEDFTSPSGIHFTDKEYVITSDGDVYETLRLDDGSTINFKSKLIFNGDGTFSVYYSAITFYREDDSDTAKFSLANIGSNVIFERVGDGDDIYGVWINKEPYEFNTGFNAMRIEINEDGTGSVIYISDNDEISIGSKWNELGVGNYIISISEPTVLINNGDGKLHDNFGYVYTRKSE